MYCNCFEKKERESFICFWKTQWSRLNWFSVIIEIVLYFIFLHAGKVLWRKKWGSLWDYFKGMNLFQNPRERIKVCTAIVFAFRKERERENFICFWKTRWLNWLQCNYWNCVIFYIFTCRESFMKWDYFKGMNLFQNPKERIKILQLFERKREFYLFLKNSMIKVKLTSV